MTGANPGSGRMHAGEVDIDGALVERLIAGQFPHWAELAIEPVPSAGTDNALYRLGDDLVVRLPRIRGATGQAALEQEWLPRLAPLLPLVIPAPLALGAPAEGYPWSWSVYRWLDGEAATIDCLTDPRQAATALGAFVAALPAGGSPPGRARRGGGAPMWLHGDLHATNLLARHGTLSAVIDFGCLGVGDPACDLMPAWIYLTADTREAFRDAAACDDAAWARGRGWALSVGLIALPYYETSNPVFAGIARHAIAEALADDG